MVREIENIRRLGGGLRENLVKCASVPDADPVHDTRTGTRRLQATLENLVRVTAEDAAGRPVRDAAAALMRLLRKIRRAAAPARDLDVHRKLVEKLVKRALGEKRKGIPIEKEASGANPQIAQPDALETPETGLRTTGLAQQAGDLDAWLKQQRAREAAGLQARAARLAAKLDKRLADLEQALRGQSRGRRSRPPAALALDNFARLATEMQILDAGNLHDFRKGAKKARYVAELAAQDDSFATQVGSTLKKLQDEIGDWHDWLVLAGEARAALGNRPAELIALVDAQREEHFVAAMKSAARLRGRLMGEWLASSRKPAAPAVPFTRTAPPRLRRAAAENNLRELPRTGPRRTP
jgi:CHAD domain-containing protein